MLKLIESDIPAGEIPISIIDQGSVEGLVKKAADSRITQFASGIQPDPSRIYVHIIAMSAGEATGANRNGDYFPEQNLIDHHETFMTSPAHVFKGHVNKDPSIAMGEVVHSVYNERMRRVELVAWIDREKGRDLVQLIESGNFPQTSMACKTPYDVCSICGNKAHTRQEYCEHLTQDLGRIYPDGRKVMALNVAPLKFFDISWVHRGACPTSSVLQKLASYTEPTVGSAELAEQMGLTEKKAAHSKLSELIKEIDEGGILDYSESLDGIMAKVSDPGRDIIPSLNQHGLGDILTTMAHLGVSPSVGFLADLIGHKLVGEEGIGVGRLVEGYLHENGLGDIPLHEGSHDQARVNPAVANLLTPHVKTASLLPEYVASRAVYHNGDVYAPVGNVGYAFNGPSLDATAMDQWKRLSSHPGASQPGGVLHMIKTLMLIGGAALAAKWYITREIERKSKEMTTSQQPGIKIVLVKSASDYRTTYRLAKYSMLSAIKKV